MCYFSDSKNSQNDLKESEGKNIFSKNLYRFFFGALQLSKLGREEHRDQCS